MTRESFGTSLSRLAALAFALVATAAVALAIVPGTALAAGPDVTIEPNDSAGSYTYQLLSDGRIQYTASPNSGWTFDHWVVRRNDGTTYNTSAYSLTTAENEAVTTAVFKSNKQDWTGTTSVSSSADYGKSGSIRIDGYLPTDATEVVIPEDSVSLSDPDSVLDSWSFDNQTGTVNYKFKDDPSKIGKKATISATVKTDKYNDYTGSVVLTVTGEAPATYKISVTADPSTGGTATVDKQEAAAGDIVKLTATPADRSWEFVGWKTDPAVTITDDAFTMPSSNVAVTAVFKKASTSTYAITFDANGGTGTMDKQTVEAGVTATLTANAFTRDGYTFAGWNTAKDGSGATYANKAEVKVEGDMTLYAQWKANSSSSKSTGKVAKTGDTALPLTAAVAMAAALGASALLVARRRMG